MAGNRQLLLQLLRVADDAGVRGGGEELLQRFRCFVAAAVVHPRL
jgi:hypothetical protein